MQIYYKPSINLKVYSVRIIWEMSELSPISMQREDNQWSATISFKKGRYHYRFLVNEMIYLIDPLANFCLPDKEGILWSVLVVDNDGKRLFNNTQYSLNIDNYIISNRNIAINDVIYNKKNTFNTLMDTMVSVRFDFSDVTGIHTISLLWINPYGDIFDISENNLLPTKQGDVVSIWFNLDIQNQMLRSQLGQWKVLLLVDGDYTLEKYFQLGQGSIYTNNGKIIISE